MIRTYSSLLVSLMACWLTLCQTFAQTAADSLPTARPYPLRAFIVPAVLVGSGTALLSHPTRYPFESQRQLTRADDYLLFGPYAVRAGLQLAGVKPALPLGDELAATIIANVGAGGVTEVLKRTVRSVRPDGSDSRSFSSGHAAIAFTGAELLHQAYRHKSPWISVAGYAMATATSVLRVANNRHRWSDVLAGAGIGIASVKVTYLVYPVVKRKLFRKQNRADRTL